MAVNKPTGDEARKGAVKKRSQLKNPLTRTMTKRNKVGGKFMAVKKTAKKFKAFGKRNKLKVLGCSTRLHSQGIPAPH